MADVTYRDLLSQYKQCLATIATGSQSYTINGRTFQRANLMDVQRMINWLELKVLEEGDPNTDNSGVVLVKVGWQDFYPWPVPASQP